MLPFYNLSPKAKMLFALVSFIGAAVFFWIDAKNSSLRPPFVSIEAAILLPALFLFLTIAASDSWARLLSKEKSEVDRTRKSAWFGAGACAALSAVSLFLARGPL